jgi:hypothetical protein
LNFEFKDDLQVESERDHIQNEQSLSSNLPSMKDLNSEVSIQNAELDEFRKTELESQY